MDDRTELERITAVETEMKHVKEGFAGMVSACRETHQKLDTKLDDFSKQLTTVQDSIDGGIDMSIDKAIKKHLPDVIVVNRTIKLSDGIKIALIGAGSAIVVAVISNWGAVVRAVGG